jgi:hypothetical protein
MSIKNIFNISNNDMSSPKIINRFGKKYNYNKNKNFSNNIKPQMISNEQFGSPKNNRKPIIPLVNNENLTLRINKNPVDILNKENYYENNQKIYSFRDLNKNLEIEKELFSKPKPEPLPVKIDKNFKLNSNNKININSSKTIAQTKKNLKTYFNNTFSKINKYNKNINEIPGYKDKNKFKNKKVCTINKNFKFPKSDINEEKLNYILKKLELENLVNVFVDNCIQFRDLFQLTKIDLREMNMPIGPRNRIYNFINEYKIYAKKYDLNELKQFFKEKTKNGIIINNNMNKLRISCSENNITKYNKPQKKNNKYFHSYYRNTSNISIFNNYYENKIINEKNKNQSLHIDLKNNDSISNSKINKSLSKEKQNEKFDKNKFHNKQNSMSDLYNKKNIYGMNKIYEERNKNKNIQSIDMDNIFTFKYDKDTIEKNESINFDSINKKSNKKCIFRSHSIKPQRNLSNLECNNEVKENNQKSNERRNKFFNNFCTISNQIEIFQTRLKQIRKKSQETNKKIDLLLAKRKKRLLLDSIKNNISDISYNNKNQKIKINSKTINNG